VRTINIPDEISKDAIRDVIVLDSYIPLSNEVLLGKVKRVIIHNYQDIYDPYHEFVPVEFDMEIGSFIPPSPNTSYYAHWLLIDSVLYLSEIKFFEDPSAILPFPNLQYRLMEEMTQVKFNKDVGSKYHLPNSILSEEGLMPAVWVSNVFLVKNIRKDKENVELWLKTSCIELVFQKGKLVSMRVKEGLS
jgi:hypothetical protein